MLHSAWITVRAVLLIILLSCAVLFVVVLGVLLGVGVLLLLLLHLSWF